METLLIEYLRHMGYEVQEIEWYRFYPGGENTMGYISVEWYPSLNIKVDFGSLLGYIYNKKSKL